MALKVLGGFIIGMIVLFNIVSDPDVTNWLNYIWVGFWVVLAVAFFIVAPSDRPPKQIKKHDKEG